MSNSSSFTDYVHSKDLQAKLYKRTLIIIVISQIFGGAGLAAGITVGALIAQDMLGMTSYAGLPAALFTFGSALFAFIVGRVTQRYGRRRGLSFGFIAGGIGAIGVVFAAITTNIWFLFIALFIYGAGTSTNLQARYAGADLANQKQRATAVSIAMVSTTLGAVAGPNLVTPMGNFATLLGIPPLAGPFILAAAAYILAGLTLFIYLRPDPFLVAKAIAEAQEETMDPLTSDTSYLNEASKNRAGIISGAIVLVFSHVIMISIMTMTPVHMQNYGAGLTAVGIVIGLHVAAMYLPSILTGRLVDTLGRFKMIVASAVTLAIAGVMAAFVPGESLLLVAIALILLGLGWNFGLISGTAMVVDSTSMKTRAKTQGSIDVWVALGGATGSLLAGVVVDFSSFLHLGLIGTYIAILLIPLVIWIRIKDKRTEKVSESS